MIHKMKLNEEYFNYIKYGTKEYEVRLNDLKRQKIKKGDFIEFRRLPLLDDKMIVEVENLLYYPSFSSLIDDIDLELLADSSFSKEELEEVLHSFYTKDEEDKYGVVAIKLKK